VAQVSAGRIERPEGYHPDDVVRATASLHYTRPWREGKAWSGTLIWARNYKTIAEYATHTVLAEAVAPLGRKNYLTGRFEWSQRDELFEYDHDLAHEVFERTSKRSFPVAAYTLGYTSELGRTKNVETALGFNFTAYTMARALKAFYGDRPVGLSVFLRFRLKAGE
jgi:hypothetical protein